MSPAILRKMLATNSQTVLALELSLVDGVKGKRLTGRKREETRALLKTAEARQRDLRRQLKQMKGYA